MTTLWIVLPIIAFGAVAIAWALLVMARDSAPKSASPPEWRHRPPSENALAMSRLFSLHDEEFLRRDPAAAPAMVGQMRAARRRVLRLFLRDLREEFREWWRQCRRAASSSKNPDFAASMMRYRLRFELLYLALWAQYLGAFLHRPAHLDLARAARVVQALREFSEASFEGPAPAGTRASVR